MPAMIVLGDKTDHGGEVIEASGVTNTHGRGIARVGDRVHCPKKGHGSTYIVTGDTTMVIDGRAVAYHGCSTSCGATLISSQMVTSVEFGPAAQVPSKAEEANSPASEETHAFDEQIKAVDPITHEPISDLSYFIEAPGGERHTGRTDSDGQCERINTRRPAELKVWFGEQATARGAE
jgi:uncharacterized Zn-binding protein involved in type VI secretion